MSGSLFVVTAPSGAGKTSLVRALLERTQDLQLSISHTTRSPRDGETEGVDYYFVDEARFHAMAESNEFLEYAHVFGNYYGTSETWVKDRLRQGIDILLELDWQGAVEIRRLMPEAIGIFILPPSRKTLEERLRKRGTDSEGNILRRLSQARDEMSHYGEADYLIFNDDFDRALDELSAVIISSRVKTAGQSLRHADTIRLLLS
jgi:guanylate kinase